MQDSTSLPTEKRSAWWKTAVNTALLLGLVGFFAREIVKNWREIVQYRWELQIELAVVALLLFLLCSLLDVAIWNRTLGWFTSPLPFVQAAPVYIWSSLARYVPGKVVSLLLRVTLSAQVKRATVPVLASSTVELALRTASAFLLFLVALLGHKTPGGKGLFTFALLTIPLVLVCAHPRVMLPVLNWGLRKIKQPSIDRSLRYRDVLGTFCLLLARWTLYGFAFFALACAVHPAAQDHPMVLVGTAAGSWAFGFVSFLPGGLGSMEWILKEALESLLHYPIAVALMLPVLLRVTTLFSEGLWALACVPMRLSWRQGQPEVRSSAASRREGALSANIEE
ncbi:MAG: hypothetical protein ACYC7E_17155 [Armatimonadota bacterium]